MVSRRRYRSHMKYLRKYADHSILDELPAEESIPAMQGNNLDPQSIRYLIDGQNDPEVIKAHLYPYQRQFAWIWTHINRIMYEYGYRLLHIREESGSVTRGESHEIVLYYVREGSQADRNTLLLTRMKKYLATLSK